MGELHIDSLDFELLGETICRRGCAYYNQISFVMAVDYFIQEAYGQRIHGTPPVCYDYYPLTLDDCNEELVLAATVLIDLGFFTLIDTAVVRNNNFSLP